MGKNARSADAIKDRAAKMRQEQQRRERRTQYVIWGILAAVVLVAGLIIYWVSSAAGSGASGDGLGEYADGRPVVVGTEVGKATAGKPTVTEYMSYSCSHCIAIAQGVSDKLLDRALAGDINVELAIVPTAAMPYTTYATAAAVATANAEPTKFVELHHQLEAFFKSQMDTQDGSIVQDDAKAKAKVQEIAQQVGLSEKTVQAITESNGQTYLKAASKRWSEAKIDGVEKDQYGTPMFVVNQNLVQITARPEQAEADLQKLYDALGAK